MNFFRRKPRNEPSVHVDETRVDACKVNQTTIVERVTVDQEAFDAARLSLDDAVAAFEGAAEAYKEDPSDKNANAVRQARHERELAELRCERPKAKLEESQRALQAAEEALCRATEEREQESRRQRVDGLLKAAGVEQYHRATRPLWESFVEARTKMHEALVQIVEQRESSNELVSELRSEGVDCPLIDAFQTIAEYCAIMCERDATLIAGFVERLQYGEDRPSGETAAAVLRSLLELTVRPCFTPEGQFIGTKLDVAGRSNRHEPPLELDRLRSFFGDNYDGWERRENERKAREKEQAAAAERERSIELQAQEAQKAKRLRAAKREAFEELTGVRRNDVEAN